VIRLTLILSGLFCGASTLAFAESEFGVYGGSQSSPHSTVTNSSSTATTAQSSLYTGWQADPFSFPIYLGLRYSRWVDADWGYALNYAHSKAKSTDQASVNYNRLEFTDGVNPITAMVMRRFSYRAVKPYVGAGLGISVPHVEVQWTNGTASKKTYEYQYGGPVATVLAGFSYPYSDKWLLFTDFQMHYLWMDVAVDGGRLKTNLITNAINVGVSYRF
jgi:lipid A oxidase